MNLILTNAHQSHTDAVSIKTLFNFSSRISPPVNNVLQRQHFIAQQLREYYASRYKSSEGIQTGAILGSALLLCFLYVIYKSKCKHQHRHRAEEQAVLHARLDQRINSLRLATLKAKLNHQQSALQHNNVVHLPSSRFKAGLLKTHQWLLNQNEVRSSEILVVSPRLCQSQPCICGTNHDKDRHNQAGENMLRTSEPLLSLGCNQQEQRCNNVIQYY